MPGNILFRFIVTELVNIYGFTQSAAENQADLFVNRGERGVDIADATLGIVSELKLRLERV
jgi:hypothetical protein